LGEGEEEDRVVFRGKEREGVKEEEEEDIITLIA
jgi:hypothetical protein